MSVDCKSNVLQIAHNFVVSAPLLTLPHGRGPGAICVAGDTAVRQKGPLSTSSAGLPCSRQGLSLSYVGSETQFYCESQTDAGQVHKILIYKSEGILVHLQRLWTLPFHQSQFSWSLFRALIFCVPQGN